MFLLSVKILSGTLVDIGCFFLGTGSTLRTAVIFFYLSNEGVSVLENAAHLGLPVPEKLKEVLAQIHNRAEKSGDHDPVEKDEPNEYNMPTKRS